MLLLPERLFPVGAKKAGRAIKPLPCYICIYEIVSAVFSPSLTLSVTSAIASSTILLVAALTVCATDATVAAADLASMYPSVNMQQFLSVKN